MTNKDADMGCLELANIIKIVSHGTGGKRNQIPIDDIYLCFTSFLVYALYYKMLWKFSTQETIFLYSVLFKFVLFTDAIPIYLSNFIFLYLFSLFQGTDVG